MQSVVTLPQASRLFVRVAVAIAVACCLFAYATPSVQAAKLTEKQVQGILSLLSSLDADEEVIANAGTVLRGNPVPSTVSALPPQAQGTPAAKPSAAACAALSKTLQQGMKDDEVSKLQAFLAQSPSLYPEKEVTGFFGAATAKAVERLQLEKGLLPSGSADLGIVGPKTRAAIACASNAPAANTPVTPEPTYAQATYAPTASQNGLPTCAIWTAPSTIVENTTYSVAWALTGTNSGTLTYPSGVQSSFSDKANGAVLESGGKTRGTYTYKMMVSNAKGTGSCSTSIVVTPPHPTATVLGTPLSFTTPIPVISGTATNITALGIDIINPLDGLEGFSIPSVLTPVINGKWTYTSTRSLPNGSWTIIVADPKAGVPLTSAGLTVSSNTQFGTYQAFRNGQLIIETKNISREDALANCKLNTSSGGTTKCVWNGEVIFTNEPVSDTTSSGSGSSNTSNDSSTSSSGSTSSTGSSSTTTTSSRSLDLKVNGSDGPLALTEGQQITLSWTSSGYTSCSVYGVWPELNTQYANIQDIGLSGERTAYAYVPGYPSFVMRLRCQATVNGSPVIADDTVSITAAGSASAQGSTLRVDGSLFTLAAAAALAPLDLLVDSLTDLLVYAGIGQP